MLTACMKIKRESKGFSHQEATTLHKEHAQETTKELEKVRSVAYVAIIVPLTYPP